MPELPLTFLIRALFPFPPEYNSGTAAPLPFLNAPPSPSFPPLQKETQALQQQVSHSNQQMDDFLARELETQNTCPICYDLMVGVWGRSVI